MVVKIWGRYRLLRYEHFVELLYLIYITTVIVLNYKYIDSMIDIVM